MTITPRILLFSQLLDTVKTNKIFQIPDEMTTYNIARDAIAFFVEYAFSIAKTEQLALFDLNITIALVNSKAENPVDASHFLQSRISAAYRETLMHAVRINAYKKNASFALDRLNEHDCANKQLLNEGKEAIPSSILRKDFVPDWYLAYCFSDPNSYLISV